MTGGVTEENMELEGAPMTRSAVPIQEIYDLIAGRTSRMRLLGFHQQLGRGTQVTGSVLCDISGARWTLHAQIGATVVDGAPFTEEEAGGACLDDLAQRVLQERERQRRLESHVALTRPEDS